jgi:hypothetical protein
MVFEHPKYHFIHKKVMEFHRVHHALSYYHHTNTLVGTETGKLNFGSFRHSIP